MLTYADGAFVRLSFRDHISSEIQSVAKFGKVSVDTDAREILVPLLFGLDDGYAEDARIAALMRRHMVVHKDNLDDDVLVEHLRQMAAHWQWQNPCGVEGRRFQRLYQACLRVHARRKIFVRSYGQTPCMPETAARRALLAGVTPLDVLCVGDDDLLSIPLAMLGHRVTVFDVDDTVLIPFLQSIASELKLDIRVEHRDLMAVQKAFPRRRFDLLFTDPMSTRECFDLFLSRGLEALRVEGRAFCAVHPLAIEIFAQVQRDMNFEVVERKHDFNHYYEEGFWENYYRSDLIELKKTKHSKPVYPLHQSAYVDIIGNELAFPHHVSVDIRSTDPKLFKREHMDAALKRIKDSGLLEVSVEAQHLNNDVYSYVAALTGGGHFALTAYLQKQLIAYDLYPYNPARDNAIREAMRQEIPQVFSLLIHKVARADQPMRGPELDTAPKQRAASSSRKAKTLSKTSVAKTAPKRKTAKKSS